MEIKIYYEDTDAGGVVYYANYLRYFERARTEFMNARGIDIVEWAKKGIQFVVVNAEIDFKSPVKLGETIKVNTTISEVKGATLTFNYVVNEKVTGRIIVSGKTRMACVNKELRPIRIPKEIMDKLTT